MRCWSSWRTLHAQLVSHSRLHTASLRRTSTMAGYGLEHLWPTLSHTLIWLHCLPARHRRLGCQARRAGLQQPPVSLHRAAEQQELLCLRTTRQNGCCLLHNSNRSRFMFHQPIHQVGEESSSAVHMLVLKCCNQQELIIIIITRMIG